jgi:cytochrome c556
MNRKTKRLAAGLLITAAGVTSVAMAAMKPEDAIHARQSIMRVMGLTFGPLAHMAQGKIPFNKKEFAEGAQRLELVWKMNPTKYFLPGTDKGIFGSGIAEYTNAKPEIWTEPAKFKKAAEHANEAIMKLAQAARSGDEDAMKSAAGGVGKACKACHDDFHKK